MGVIGDIIGGRQKLSNALDPAAASVAPVAPVKPPETPIVPAKTPQQAAYEAKEKTMNRNNPYYKNVDNSGLTKETP